jgi:hypothetical protein
MLKFAGWHDDNLSADYIERNAFAAGPTIRQMDKIRDLDNPRRWPMMASNTSRRGWRGGLLVLGLFGLLGLTGCQIDVGGQTLPSPFYLNDDVQYFPPGTQFPLSKEAAAQKSVSLEQTQQR